MVNNTSQYRVTSLCMTYTYIETYIYILVFMSCCFVLIFLMQVEVSNIGHSKPVFIVVTNIQYNPMKQTFLLSQASDIVLLVGELHKQVKGIF